MSTRPVPCNLDGWPGVTDLVVDYKFLLHVLWSSPSSLVSVIGVGGPGTIERLISAARTDETVVLEALREFERRGLVVIDEKTREVCIRGWLRFHNLEGRWRIAARKAYENVVSNKIKGVLVAHEGVKAFFPEKSTVITANTTQHNTTLTTTTTTTTTTPEVVGFSDVVCGGDFENLVFEPALEKIGKADLIIALQEAGVQDSLLAQDLLDELAGVLEAAARGERATVANPAIWLSKVVEGFKPARCRQVQDRRRRATEANAAHQAALTLSVEQDDEALAKGQQLWSKWTHKEKTGEAIA